MVFSVVERSISSLLKDIVGNLQQIIRAEVRLAKVEVGEELSKARQAMVLLAIGAGAVGGALVAVGISQIKRVSLPPARTVTSVQENIQWAKAQAR